jgi:dTDP-4-dehydrorhamnose 3,5-epimerase-like enzyme
MKIKKIKLINLKSIKNPKGDILKYLSKDSKYYKKFGEIYFSEIKKNKKKGWNLHKSNSCFIAVPYGKVEFFIQKDNKKIIKKVILSKKNYKLLIIPKGYWFSFKSLSNISIIANSLEQIHQDKETRKKPIN